MSSSSRHGSKSSPANGNGGSVIFLVYKMVLQMQDNTAELLSTYTSLQGKPFNDQGFKVPEYQLKNLPCAKLINHEWEELSDADRLTQTFIAYTILRKLMQLVLTEQQDLNPKSDSLFTMLKSTMAMIDALLANVTTIMQQMSVPIPAVTDPLAAEPKKLPIFEKKLRGYAVCKEYGDWVERSVCDFSHLKEKFPTHG